MTDSASWYYNQDGIAMGPFDSETLARRLHEGDFQPDTLFWQPSMEQWQPLSEVAAELTRDAECPIVQPGPLRMPLPSKKNGVTSPTAASISKLQPIHHRPPPVPHDTPDTGSTTAKSGLLKRLLGMKN